MVSIVPVRQVSVADLRDRYGLTLSTEPDFFSELSVASLSLTEREMQDLDRVKTNFLGLLQKPPLLENSVKMVVVSPLFDLAGFYREPFRIESETSIELQGKDEGEVIRGRIDVLVLQQRLWLLVLESKSSDFAVNVGIGQALTYMMTNPNSDRPIFGAICNGTDFLFLKLVRSPQPKYAHSRLFSLLNPDNDLYDVLKLFKNLEKALS